MATDENRVAKEGRQEEGSLPLMDDDQIEDSLATLESVFPGPKTPEIQENIANIELVASSGGLRQDHIDRLVKLVTTVAVQPQLFRRLVYSLVPRSAIPASTLVRLALWLGQSSLSRDCVVLPILRTVCLCLQYDCLTDRTELNPLYELFISFLHKDKLTQVVSELLCLLTVRAQVTKWRVRKVLSAQSSLGSSYHLDHLVWKFRQLRPDLVPHCPAPSSRAASQTSLQAKRFHTAWVNKLEVGVLKRGLWQIGHLSSNKTYKKGGRDCLVPSAEVLTVSQARNSRPLIALTDCTSLDEVVDNLHQLQLPANILSLLGCGASLTLLASDQGLVERLSITLYHTLKYEFFATDQVVGGPAAQARKFRRCSMLLDLMAELQERLHQGIPVIGRFLSEYLVDVWDGQIHFKQVLRLMAKLQITDFTELYDCILAPMEQYFKTYSMAQQTTLVMYLHSLLRHWGSLEHERFVSHRQGIFPVNSHNCDNSLESIIELSKHIGEIALLALVLGREKDENMDLLVGQVVCLALTTQKVMLKVKVPLRVELPNQFIYAALFSQHPVHLAQVCSFILNDKREVWPALKRREAELEAQGDGVNRALVASMISAACVESQKTAVLDLLAFLAPGKVEVMPASILKQPWVLRGDVDETWLRESLYISCHPAFLPQVISYFDSLGLNPTERQDAWLQLCVEPETETPEGQPGSRGNIFHFLTHLAKQFSSVTELIREFRPAASGRKESRRETVDTQSMASQRTEADSGVFSGEPNSKQSMPPPIETGVKTTRKRTLSGNKEKQIGKETSSKRRTPPEGEGPTKGEAQKGTRRLRNRK